MPGILRQHAEELFALELEELRKIIDSELQKKKK